MDTQDQIEEVAEVKISDLDRDEIAKRMADCKVIIKDTEAYYDELEAEMVTRIDAGKVMDFTHAFTIHTGEVVNKTVSIRHQHKEGLKYNDKQIINHLREDEIPYGETYISPARTKQVDVPESLDQKEFESNIFIDDDLEPLRKLVTKTSRDWCVVTGVPK